jgi:phage gpG-like protein
MKKGRQFNFEQKIIEFKKFEKTVPRLIGNIAKIQFVENFDHEGFTDEAVGSDPWKKRKRNDKNSSRRNILVKTGALRRSIRVGSSPTFRRIVIGSYGLNYAKIHNEGSGKMPQRKFLGQSRLLDKKISALIRAKMIKIL